MSGMPPRASVLTGSPARLRADIYYVSLAGSFLGKPDLETGETTVIEPKTKDAGDRVLTGHALGCEERQLCNWRRSGSDFSTP